MCVYIIRSRSIATTITTTIPITRDTFITTEVRLSQGHFRGLRADGGILSIYTSVKTHKILGAELCAFKGDKIAQLLALAMENELTVDTLAQYSFFNLSAETVITQAAKEAVKRLNKKQIQTHNLRVKGS